MAAKKIFWVDIPKPPEPDTDGEWKNVATCQSREEAIEFIKENIDPTCTDGTVQLISEGCEDEDVLIEEQEQKQIEILRQKQIEILRQKLTNPQLKNDIEKHLRADHLTLNTGGYHNGVENVVTIDINDDSYTYYNTTEWQADAQVCAEIFNIHVLGSEEETEEDQEVQGSNSELLEITKELLRIHEDDIESGIKEGTYEAEDNVDSRAFIARARKVIHKIENPPDFGN